MASYRIYQIAKDNSLTSKEVLEICSNLKIEAKSHASVITDNEYKKIIEVINKDKKIEKKAAQDKKPEKELQKINKDEKINKEKVKTENPQAAAKKEISKEKISDKSSKNENDIKNEKNNKDFKKNDTSENEVREKQKPLRWEEEKRINIRSVLFKELDKEDKLVKTRGKPAVKAVKKESVAPTAQADRITEVVEDKEPEKKRPEIKKNIELAQGTTVKQLSEKINVSSAEIIKKLFSLGEIVSLNQTLENDLIEILSEEYSFKYSVISFEEKIDELYRDEPKDLIQRPPIVTVMGHVDHGKTTLLDAVRKTDVAGGEAGGITQHIGAYQVEYKGRKITFIDTPGHEAFTSMRARGAKVTDIAIIVVAANDGIMPQTVEAIDHAKAAKVPIIVAINKIDLNDADPSKVKKSLTEYGLVPEEWGGDTICVEVSAKSKINIDALLEMILLLADMNDIKGNPDAEGFGIIIESRLDKGLGPVGSLIIKRGSVKAGDFFITGNSFGKVRAIQDDKGVRISKAYLSQPVEILGFSSVPKAGDKFFIVKSEKMAKEIIAKKNYNEDIKKISDSKRHISLEQLSDLANSSEIKKLDIILKADVNGSLDAVEQSIRKIEDERIEINIIHRGVGAIIDSDIILSIASNAIIIGFGVVPTAKAKLMAKEEKIEIRTYNIIYKLIDDLIAAFKGMLEPKIEEVEKGRVEIREVFKMPKIGIVAGCYILEGEVERGNPVRVIRDGKIVFVGKIGSIHRFKEDVKKVAAGYECGIKVENFQDVNKDDILEIYEIKEVPQ